ncbi:MAG: sulfotransferase, partial [Pseudomonadota bacterium]|nr:sulfotransferase [Pseudomonadota bacterium]
LVGFPRSGTTLLENALAGHPDIVALEEADALARAGGELLADFTRLERLSRLTGAEAEAAREIYWARVRELAPRAGGAKVFIDKMPVQTVALPLITKLFPGAKILFARRDPRDVVLSCFRRLFGINTVMAQFLTLDGAARYYDQVMRLAVLYEKLLPVDLHVVRHEDLVADFDHELSTILDFFDLPWDPSVRDFTRRAIGSRTPSATQIARGLNAEGVGAWRRFAKEMAPVLPLLDPWAARFGYPPADPDALPSHAK